MTQKNVLNKIKKSMFYQQIRAGYAHQPLFQCVLSFKALKGQCCTFTVPSLYTFLNNLTSEFLCDYLESKRVNKYSMFSVHLQSLTSRTHPHSSKYALNWRDSIVNR